MTGEEWSERCNVAGFEVRGRGPWAEECRWPLEAACGKKKKKRNPPLES